MVLSENHRLEDSAEERARVVRTTAARRRRSRRRRLPPAAASPAAASRLRSLCLSRRRRRHPLDPQVHEGARIERARTAKGQEVGPRRAWPGGLAVARTLGDSDAGSYVLPQPALQAVTLPIGGAAVVICSDGVWDAVGVGDAAHMLQVR